jgi:two-component system OmpR family response regulator
MERHGGRLEVTSWPGMGSRFSAIFRVAREPLLRGLHDSGGGADPSLGLGSRTGSALVVEDDENSREGAVTVLRSAGYTVRAVPDRASALAAMGQDPADLVVLDAQLPDGDGLEIVGALREAAAGRRVVVVALSADRIGDAAERAVRAGCDEFLLKPVEPRELLRRVAELIDAG